MDEYVTKLEVSNLLREFDAKITGAINKAEKSAECENGKAALQVSKDAAIVALAYDKTVASLGKQIETLNGRVDKFMWYVIGTAISTLLMGVMMLAGILLGKV